MEYHAIFGSSNMLDIDTDGNCDRQTTDAKPGERIYPANFAPFVICGMKTPKEEKRSTSHRKKIDDSHSNVHSCTIGNRTSCADSVNFRWVSGMRLTNFGPG